MKRMKRIVKKLRCVDKKLDRRNENGFNKAIFVNIKPELYYEIKFRAKERNISMRQWVTRAVTRDLKRELRND